MNHESMKVSAAMTAALTQSADQRPSNPGYTLAQTLLDSIVALGAERFPSLVEEVVQDTTKQLDYVTVAVTGLGWLGAGFPAVDRVLVELIQGARREVLITAYSITSGADRVLKAIEGALQVGVRCTLMVNAFGEQTTEVRQFLNTLKSTYPSTLSLLDFVGGTRSTLLHAKIVVADREVALIGSANLSFSGLVGSHELAVVIRGPTAGKVSQRIDALITSRYVEEIG